MNLIVIANTPCPYKQSFLVIHLLM